MPSVSWQPESGLFLCDCAFQGEAPESQPALDLICSPLSDPWDSEYPQYRTFAGGQTDEAHSWLHSRCQTGLNYWNPGKWLRKQGWDEKAGPENKGENLSLHLRFIILAFSFHVCFCHLSFRWDHVLEVRESEEYTADFPSLPSPLNLIPLSTSAKAHIIFYSVQRAFTSISSHNNCVGDLWLQLYHEREKSSLPPSYREKSE